MKCDQLGLFVVVVVAVDGWTMAAFAELRHTAHAELVLDSGFDFEVIRLGQIALSSGRMSRVIYRFFSWVELVE